MAENGEKIKKPLRDRMDVYLASRKVAQRLECDVAIINSAIERHLDNSFIVKVRKFRQSKNLLLFIVTPGGDADAAYRIARCAQDNYEKVIVFVSGYCKSAGTLCVLGANEIIMSDQGELGPLDVQLYKKDELGEMHSGLVIGEALQTLQQQAFSMFEHYFLEIKRRSAGTVTFKTATETAAKMVTGLFQPIYSQIDPSLIGDIGRSMTIAKDYGQRLLIKSQNFSAATLSMLVESYPAHGFVIDRREAQGLFHHVRAPEDDEGRLARKLSPISRFPQDDEQIVEFLYPNADLEKILKENEDATHSEAPSEQSANTGANGSGESSDVRDPQTPEGTPQPDTSDDSNAKSSPSGQA
ncbi:SDH family Clp fold serine proteinase [Burkholderia pseudomallei]|uniref:SDH family Clp fold serine proteinase n=1 Tax=Burkholderia pseudomallei TaxID=28450 RepID=UPI0001A48545|nr:SppA protein [Burkholderia pseudomallei]ACQ95305.1 SppA protein [Burkholderia pseudomallei MSHR346]AIP09969.1 clp protease family protein [Burkholderia pseudomallei]